MTDTRDVFVVYGRNLAARDALFDFLRTLDLHPMEWSELVSSTGSGSPSIGQVLDAAFDRAQAVVVLLTPDDEARLQEQFRGADDASHESDLTGQAHPNVLFEAGMALARHQDRTILVQFGDVRPFSDIAGRHVLKLFDNAASRNQLANRLKAAGSAVKTLGDDWLGAGDFAEALASAVAPTQDSSQGVVAGKEDPDSRSDSGEYPRGRASGIENAGLLPSGDAAELLLSTASAGQYIARTQYGGRRRIATSNREFVNAHVSDPKAVRWEAALDELFKKGLADNNGAETYYLTHEGGELARKLAK